MSTYKSDQSSPTAPTLTTPQAEVYVRSARTGDSSKFARALDFVEAASYPAATAAGVFGKQVVATAISASTEAMGTLGTGAQRGAMGFISPPAPPGLGGGGLGNVSSPGLMGGLGGPGGYQTQIDAMFNNNMQFLVLQTRVQAYGQQFQSVSNVMKADYDARIATIRNFRS